ncbi:MAG: hypothetical protein II794_00910 [Oscillospiraceae bacterium]|nr:hypothetical protein [Oscillospiraceae bacterium]
MADTKAPREQAEEVTVSEAVCVHTDKVFDSCRSRDCFDDLRVYVTESSQTAIDAASGVSARRAELIYADAAVSPVQFNRGYYTVLVNYYYRLTGETLPPAAQPVLGLCIASKQVLLYGSEGSAKVFSSAGSIEDVTAASLPTYRLPEAVVEALEPICLEMKLVNADAVMPDAVVPLIPQPIADLFPEELVTAQDVRRVYCTLGQFSLVRLQRSSQLLIPAYDYCVPESECVGADSDDPCTLFARIDFPVNEFFPPDTVNSVTDTYRRALEETTKT